MLLSISTASFYFMPFEAALDVIAQAGFEAVELAGYCQSGPYETAQHLKGADPRWAVKQVEARGLRIATYHDMGGVIAPDGTGWLASDVAGYAACAQIPYLVTHAPHASEQPNWWAGFADSLREQARALAARGRICLENMGPMAGYTVALQDPAGMLAFAEQIGAWVNLDTTHCAECGQDPVTAARILAPRLRTLHISDYAAGRKHLFPGDGQIDFPALFASLRGLPIHAATLECDLPRQVAGAMLDACRRALDWMRQLA